MSREVAPGVYRLGSDYINYYVVAEGDRFTVVDTGLSGYWDQLPGLLSSLGASLDAIDAVLLTHHHLDHIGTAERVRTEADAPVHVHPEDAALVKRPDTKPPKAPVWRPAVLRYFLHILTNGGMKVTPVAEVATFEDTETLEVPGRPRVVHCPGHTSGSCALYLEGRKVLLVGDVLANMDAITGKPGPRIAPKFINADSEQALASLANLDGLEAEVTLFGHGEPWTRALSEALALARRVGLG